MGEVLTWFSYHRFAYDALGVLALAAFVVLCSRERPVAPKVVLLAAAAVFFSWRWIALACNGALNPDEAQMIANALKATVDPLPWRGFGGATGGPLDSDVLALPALFGFPIAYGTTRLVGGALLLGAAASTYFAALWTYGERVARWSLIPIVGLLSVVDHWDFVHYSSEVLPIALITLALPCAAAIARGEASAPAPRRAAFIAGIALGAVPFCKLQAIPLALVVLCYLLAVMVRSRRRRDTVLALAAGGAVPAVVILGAVVLTGEWRDMLISYVWWPKTYVQAGGPGVRPQFFFVPVPQYGVFALWSTIVAAAALLLAYRSRVRPARSALLAPAFAAAIVAAALFCIVVPRREFPHYLMLSVFPFAWLVASSTGVAASAAGKHPRPGLIAAAGVAVLAPIVAITLSLPNPLVDALRTDLAPPDPVTVAISQYAKPGDATLVWGWMADYYVSTGTIMAARDANSVHEIDANPYRDYFVERFMRDVQRDPPRVIVDAVAPASFYFHDRTTTGLERFAPLASLVRSDYVLRAEIGGVRVFARTR